MDHLSWSFVDVVRKISHCRSAGLETIGPGSVATLRTKSGTFRILRDVDFRRSMVALSTCTVYRRA